MCDRVVNSSIFTSRGNGPGAPFTMVRVAEGAKLAEAGMGIRARAPACVSTTAVEPAASDPGDWLS